MKFLVVDDSKAMRNMVIRSLKQAGYTDHEFKQAADGIEALKIIKEWGPRVVLTDWHMPKMDGLELLDKVNSLGLDVRIGMVTTENADHRVKMALDAGALFVVSKPFTTGELQNAVLEALRTDIDDSDSSPSSGSTAPKSKVTLPTPKPLLEMLKALVGPELSVHVSTPKPIQKYPIMIGIFANQQGKAKAIAVLDHELSCYLGGALTKFVPGHVFEAIRKREIPSEIFDNTSEILNISTTLFQCPDTDQGLVFKSSHILVEPSRKIDLIMANKNKPKSSFEIQLDDYGTGELTLVAI